jgi:hypothetical protein
MERRVPYLLLPNFHIVISKLGQLALPYFEPPFILLRIHKDASLKAHIEVHGDTQKGAGKALRQSGKMAKKGQKNLEKNK